MLLEEIKAAAAAMVAEERARFPNGGGDGGEGDTGRRPGGPPLGALEFPVKVVTYLLSCHAKEARVSKLLRTFLMLSTVAFVGIFCVPIFFFLE